MKTKLLLLCCLWALFVPVKAQKKTQVLLVALDGISTEGLIAAQTPHIDRLMHEGAWTYKARNVIPSNTLPNWTSMLCGSGPERHGVTTNSWTVNNRTLSSISMDDDGYYPSIFKVVKEQVPDALTAYYWNWKQLINSINPSYLDESNYLANDAYIPNYERAFEFMRTNRDKSWLTFLYDVHTDHAGHGYKWMSPQYIKSIEEADVQIGVLLDKLKEEGMYDDMYIFFLTDHGGINSGHGGYTDNEMLIPFSVKGKGIKQGEIKDHYFTVNTASTIARLFGVRQPQEWCGMVVESMFGLSNPSILISDAEESPIYYTIKNLSEDGCLTVVDGAVAVSTSTGEGDAWYLLKAESDKYVICSKAYPNKVLGEKTGVPALVDKADGDAWYLCANPDKAGAYSIAQSADASEKCLKANSDGTVGYWVPSAFNHAGILWSLNSDDVRTLIDEKRAELDAVIKNAAKVYATIQNRINNNIPGSYTEGVGASLNSALEQACTVAADDKATVGNIDEVIALLNNALAEVAAAPVVGFENGAVYRIKNADSRFGGLTYIYSTDENIVRWGIVNPAVASDNYEWRITVDSDENGDVFTLYNVGTGRYLGSSAWDAARPSSITTSTTAVQYRFDNTKGEDLREWCLRSIDSESVQNPSKSYLACTDDNANNLTDGRVLPWNPTDATAMHDGFWIFEKVSESTTPEDVLAKQQELKEVIKQAEAFARLMEKTLQTKTVGSYTSEEALTQLKTAIAKATDVSESENLAALEEAITKLTEDLDAARTSPQVTFKNGATYRIVNADPRFDADPIHLYINSSDIARWGIESRIDPAGSDLWTIEVEGKDLRLLNVRTQKYLGSSAWDASRPANIKVTEEPVLYQVDNTFDEDPREWCLRSVDSYHVANDHKSYLACSGDSNTNLAEGIIRPWDPTDSKVGLHDAFWIFEEVEDLPDGITTKSIPAERVSVVGGRIVVDPESTPFTVYATDGKQMKNNGKLSNGAYIVNTPNKSYKVLVN